MNDILLHIFSFLYPKDIGSCTLVNQTFREIIANQILWKIFIERDYSESNHLRKSNYYQIYKNVIN